MLIGKEDSIRLSPARTDFTCRAQDAGRRNQGPGKHYY
jgi:hypothetical protein